MQMQFATLYNLELRIYPNVIWSFLALNFHLHVFDLVFPL